VTPPLPLESVWRAAYATVRRDIGTWVTLTAAFVFLPEMLLGLYGPKPPMTMDEITPNVMLVQMALPAAIAAIAQLAIAALVISAHDAGRASGVTVGGALRSALLLLPVLLLTVLLAAVPVTAGLFALVVPAVYLLGRFSLVLPLVVAAPANPVVILQRSWALTEGNGWRAALYVIVLTVLFTVGALLAAVFGSALGSVLTLVAGKSAGVFAATLVASAATAVFGAANAVASAMLYLWLRDNAR
jgi:hypothetical protein